MFDKAWRSVSPKTILNCFIKPDFKECDNYVPIDNSDIPDNKWNFVVDHFNLDDGIFTHYVEIDNDVRVCVKHRQMTKLYWKLSKISIVARLKTNN